MADRSTPTRVALALCVASISTVVWVEDRGLEVLARPGPPVLWALLVCVSYCAVRQRSPSPEGRGVTVVLLGGVVVVQLVAIATDWVTVPTAVLLVWTAFVAVGARVTRLDASFVAVDAATGSLVSWADRVRRVLVSQWSVRDADEVETATWLTPAVLALVAASFLVGIVVALRDLRWVLYDDAAITLRYAWRIADGRGFTYNPGDRTNGASAPMYTLLLAGIRVLGGDLVSAAKAIGVIAYGVSLALVAAIVGRVARTGAALLAVVIVVASVDYRMEVLSGMESGVAVALGLGAILCAVEHRDGLAGVLLGLAVFNKLDGTLLLVALLGSVWLVQHRFPRRTVIAALAVSVPWFVFSTAYFGSPIPYSASQKLNVVGNPASTHDPLWVVRTLVADGQAVVLSLAIIATGWSVLARGAPGRLRLAVATSGIWLLMHLVAFSVIDLGDRYSWYVTVLYPLIAISASIGIAAFIWWVSDSGWLGWIATVVVGTGILLMASGWVPGVLTAARVVVDGHTPDAYERFEATRREAGRYLADHVDSYDVVETCWGWVAFGVPRNPIRETCPLNTRREVAFPTWSVSSVWADAATAASNPRTVLMARFRSCGEPTGSTDVNRLDTEERLTETAEPPPSPCLDGG